jgi:predicted O-methyltransferase YrrM
MQQLDEKMQKQPEVRATWNKAEAVLRKIEKTANHEFLPIVDPAKGQVIVETLRMAKPKRILEVDTLIGCSAILMGKELDDDAQIITIKIHADEAKTAEENIGNAAIPKKSKC